MAIDGFGAMMRMQGYRPLVAMDEVFKVMARGMKIEELATTAKINSLKQSKAAGIPDEKAQTLATAAMSKLYIVIVHLMKQYSLVSMLHSKMIYLHSLGISKVLSIILL